MITKQMIIDGLKSGVIAIVCDFGGCLGICCKIGCNSFYFLGMECDDLTIDEYWKCYTIDTTADMLHDVLKDADAAEYAGLDDGEYEYYKSVLVGGDYNENTCRI